MAATLAAISVAEMHLHSEDREDRCERVVVPTAVVCCASIRTAVQLAEDPVTFSIDSGDAFRAKLAGSIFACSLFTPQHIYIHLIRSI